MIKLVGEEAKVTQCQLLASSLSISFSAEQRCSCMKTEVRTTRAERKRGGMGCGGVGEDVGIGERCEEVEVEGRGMGAESTEDPGGGRMWVWRVGLGGRGEGILLVGVGELGWG